MVYQLQEFFENLSKYTKNMSAEADILQFWYLFVYFIRFGCGNESGVQA